MKTTFVLSIFLTTLITVAMSKPAEAGTEIMNLKFKPVAYTNCLKVKTREAAGDEALVADPEDFKLKKLAALENARELPLNMDLVQVERAYGSEYAGHVSRKSYSVEDCILDDQSLGVRAKVIGEAATVYYQGR